MPLGKGSVVGWRRVVEGAHLHSRAHRVLHVFYGERFPYLVILLFGVLRKAVCEPEPAADHPLCYLCPVDSIPSVPDHSDGIEPREGDPFPDIRIGATRRAKHHVLIQELRVLMPEIRARGRHMHEPQIGHVLYKKRACEYLFTSSLVQPQAPPRPHSPSGRGR